jgi:hypothetical protein
MSLKHVAVVCGIALGAFGLNPAEAQAAKNKYAMVGISNPTSIAINYYFRWGKNSEWKAFTVQPGRAKWHSWEYDYVNQNSSPVPQVKFDEDLSDEVSYIIYDLKAYASPDQDYDNSKKYKFVIKGRGTVLGIHSLDD